jgi:hypothetical protein
MARYITAGWVENVDFDYGEPHRPQLSVMESAACDTGLLSADGQRIMRVNDPIGFSNPKDGG